MASRFYKIGTIFSRVQGFINKGLIKYEDRPLWYDIYAHFPPKYAPTFARPVQDIEIQEIFYPEDVIRAKIHQNPAFKPVVYDIRNETVKSKSQKCMESYKELISQGMSDSEALDQLFVTKNYTVDVTHRLPPRASSDDMFVLKDFDQISDDQYNVDGEVDVPPPVIPMAKTVPGSDDSNKDSKK